MVSRHTVPRLQKKLNRSKCFCSRGSENAAQSAAATPGGFYASEIALAFEAEEGVEMAGVGEEDFTMGESGSVCGCEVFFD